MVSGVSYNVLYRYITGRSIAIVAEGAVVLLLWIVFLGASTGYYHDMFPAFTTLHGRLGRRSGQVLKTVVLLISLSVFAYLTFLGWRYSQSSWGQVTPILSANRGAIYLALPVSGALLSLAATEKLLISLFDDEATSIPTETSR